MSGVFGIVDSREQTDARSIAEKMAVVMCHRDWYVAETYVSDKNNLAFGRIGIGIFNRPHQPIWNETQDVGLVMAGEFYNKNNVKGNFAEESDEQYALYLYERHGEAFIHELSGAFVITIYDKKRNKLLIVNDRYGLYPLFYAFRNNGIIFSPEVKGILCDNTFLKKLDLTSLAQYVRFQHLLGERTFFEGIQLLPNASFLIYDLDSRTCCIKPYWTFDDIPYLPDIEFNEAVEEAGYLFRQSVKRLSSDSYRPGVYLSGGLDSRSILGMVERRPVVSLTYGERNSRDVFYAARIAKALGTDHHWFDFPNGEWVKEQAGFHLELTEGFHSWIHAHGISTLPTARQLIDVNLTGWDGGTVMGHNELIEPLQISAVDELAFITRLYYLFNQKYTWPSINEAEENLLFHKSIHNQIQGLAFDSFRSEVSRFWNYRPDVRSEFFYIRNHVFRLTHNLVTFTRSHIEVRFPFFDYQLLEFLHSIPAQVRGHRILYKAVIQREMPRLSYIPFEKDEFLPTTQTFIREMHKGVVKLKHRFNRHIWRAFPELSPLYADYEAYLRNELREWAEHILFDRRTLEREIFDPAYLRTLMDRHLSNLEEWTIGKVAPIMTYEMMLRRYFD